jgi:Uncharacterised protein family (UPF0236)
VAADAGQFQLDQAPPPSNEEAELLVVTADGKGVPMKRPLEERARSSPRRKKGEKANKKRMACVGAVYTVDRFVRSPEEIVDEILRHARSKTRPKPKHKHVWAEMTETNSVAGKESNGREVMFLRMALAAARRDPLRAKTMICLLDGERALWDQQRAWLRRAIGILDLFHVLERVWQAAHCFHPEGSDASRTFVARNLTLLLQGKVGFVIGTWRRESKRRSLAGAKRKTLEAAITYYQNNRQHMRYNEYLAAGYPIGSGVAEGACRHLVKDRMERTGMRWTVEGAQAMLRLRAIHINGQWESYMTHRIQAEQTRLYGQAA